MEEKKENPFLEADKMQGFLDEYMLLCRKWGYMFFAQPPSIQKVEFMPLPNQETNDPTSKTI